MVVMLAAAWALPTEEVIVHAPQGPVEGATPASVTVIEIDERLPVGADTAAVIGTASGVAVSRLGGLGDFASVSLRGSTSRAVEIFLDGVPLNPDGAGSVDLSELPLNAFQRIEIWRGNAPVGLGGTAMGGVVNLVSGEGPATAIGATAGSFDTVRLTALVARSWESEDVWVAGQYLSTVGDFRWFDDAGTRFVAEDDAERVRENNDTRQGTLHARVRGGKGGPLRWTLLDSLVVREEGIPGFTSQPTSGVRYGTARNLLVGSVEAGKAVPVRLRGHFRQRVETLRDPLGEVDGDRTDGTRSGGLDLRTGYARPAWRIDFSSSARLDTLDEDGLDSQSRTVGTISAGFQSWSWANRLVLAPVVSATGLRSGSDSSQGALLPRLGVLVRPLKGLALKANVGRYFRPPDLVELYGNRGVLVGRANLRPERGIQLDLGMRLEGEVGSFEAGVFQTEATDLITYVQNAQQVAIPTNLARTTVRGVEAAVGVTGIPWLDLQSNLTLQQSRQRSGDPAFEGKAVPRVPGIQFDQRLALVSRRFRLGGTLSYRDVVYTDAVNWNRQAPRPLTGLFFRYAPRGPFQLDLDLQNALGVRTQRVPANPLDPESERVRTALSDFVGYPLPGRTLLVTLRFSE